jgi:hypothetical protein
LFERRERRLKFNHFMDKQLLYFRPGEEARMLARCQFGAKDGRCGATLTYPIRGYPWRNNVMKSYQFNLDQTAIDALFADVHRIRKEYPDECLAHDELFNDASEKANGITRDRSTGTLCYSISIFLDHAPEEQFSLREDSPALLQSTLFQVISSLIAPYETLQS